MTPLEHQDYEDFDSLSPVWIVLASALLLGGILLAYVYFVRL